MKFNFLVSVSLLFAMASSGQTYNNKINASGNVGIGTTSPTNKLHIAISSQLDSSAIRIGFAGDTGKLAVPVGGVAGAYNIDFHTYRDMTPNQVGARIRAERINRYAPDNALIQGMDLAFSTSPAGVQTDLSERMRINYLGNVGIGTNTPGARLHIVNGLQQILFGSGPCTSGYNLNIGVNDNGVNISNNSTVRGFIFSNSNGTLLQMSPTGDLTTYGSGITKHLGPVTFIGPGAVDEPSNTLKRGLYIDNGANTAWEFMTVQNASGVKMKITKDGDVLIGGPIAQQGYKLAVNGTIGGRKVKVTQETWADFVFHHDYALPSIQEVAQYIGQHQHLPGIPAEKEVKAEGIDLGEMNKLLLQKVEEQMLYIIQLNKQVQQLTEKVEQLSTK